MSVWDLTQSARAGNRHAQSYRAGRPGARSRSRLDLWTLPDRAVPTWPEYPAAALEARITA